MLVLEPATVTVDSAWSRHQMDYQLIDDVGASKVDLEVQLDEQAAGELAGRLIYDRELLERGTAVRLRDHWLRPIELVAVTDPTAPISALSMFAPAEEQRQLAEWNAGISYAELDRRSDQSAGPLAPVGEPSGQRIVDALIARTKREACFR